MRYYFDMQINGVSTRDHAGVELDDRQKPKRLADTLVVQRAESRNRAEDFDCRCTVRDEDGRFVYDHRLVIPAFSAEEMALLEERRTRR